LEILLEDIRAQNRATIEAVLSTRQALEAKMDAQRLELLNRIEALEAAVRINSQEIRKNSQEIRKNSQEIRKNSQEIRKNTEEIQKNSEEIRKNRQEIRKNSDDIRLILMKLDAKTDAAQLAQIEKRVEALERQAAIR